MRRNFLWVTLTSLVSFFGYIGADFSRGALPQHGRNVSTSTQVNDVTLSQQLTTPDPTNSSFWIPQNSTVASPAKTTTQAAQNLCPWNCENVKCGVARLPVKKIAGGMTSKRFSWPWMGSIWSNGTLVCGATLICKSWVIAAAHCFLDTNGRKIDLGRQRNLYLGRYLKRGNYKAVLKIPLQAHMITVHEDYHIWKSYNDIALVRLLKPIKYSRRIRPACLPSIGSKPPSVGVTCRVAGWGDTMGMGPKNNRLKEANITLVSTDTCKYTYYFSRTQQILCAGGEKGQDTCAGDSGGPLICESPVTPGKWELQGVISFGASKCGTEDIPGIYSQVVYYLHWIRNVMDNECMLWNFLNR